MLGVLSCRHEETAVASRLVGHRALMWDFIGDTAALEIRFETGLTLKMAPYDGVDVLRTAWALRLPDEYYGLVRWDSVIRMGRHDGKPM